MRYAKALIEYAKDTGAEDRVYHELRMLERSFRKHPDLREALDNPILKIKEKFAPFYHPCAEKSAGVLFAVHLSDLSRPIQEVEAYWRRKTDYRRTCEPGCLGTHSE